MQTGGAGAGVWEEHHDRSAWQFVACYYRVLGQAHTEEGHQAGALYDTEFLHPGSPVQDVYALTQVRTTSGS